MSDKKEHPVYVMNNGQQVLVAGVSVTTWTKDGKPKTSIAMKCDEEAFAAAMEPMRLSIPFKPEGSMNDQWQSMVTAPKDESTIEVYLERGTVPIVHLAWWNDGSLWESGGFSSQEDAAGWWSNTTNSVSQDKVEPLFWRPFISPYSKGSNL